MTCLSVEEIALYIAGSDSSGDAARIAHVESCETCRASIGAAVRAGRRLAYDGDDLALGTSIGRYVITGWLGSGGMGRVYAAYDPQLDRKVALKLLRSGDDAERCARLVREAQAAAQLSHPNVVAVYDAGTVGAEVFVAMELVDGETLRSWLATPRDRRAIVDAFRQAGLGIAAAHAAGLIHRDIKPDNIMIGRDGRVRVTDFGVARAVIDETSEPRDGDLQLTRTDGVLGTPAYMSPEQLLGDPTDARSDQFSFCVALYEGLYGERPFAGETVQAITASVVEGRIRTPARDPVPGWLRKIVVRGLATQPEDRFAAMTDLLAALGRDPRIRNRRIALAVIAVTALVGGVAWTRREPVALPCQDSEHRIAGAWNADRKLAVAAAFAATRRPFADLAVAHVDAALDRYVAEWTAMHRDACEATHVRGEQSEDLLDRRNACLEERRAALTAQTELFAHADGGLVDRSVKLVDDLPDLAPCADARGLLALVPPPRDALRRNALEQLRGRVGGARVLERSARYPEARRAVDELRGAVAALGYAPLTAELDELDGTIAEALVDPKAAIAAFDRAALDAEAGGDDATKARALLGGARVRGLFEVERDRVDPMIAQVRATMTRIGGAPDVEIELERALGAIAAMRTKYGDALPHYQRAVELAARQFGANDVRTVTLEVSLDETINQLGRADDAKRRLTRAIETLSRELGAGHPEVARARHVLANVLYDEGKFDDALAMLERARTDLEHVFGANDAAQTPILFEIGNLYTTLFHFKEALAIYERCHDVDERVYGHDHPTTLRDRLDIATALFGLDRDEPSIAAFREVIDTGTRTIGAQSPLVAAAQLGLSQPLQHVGRPREALVAATAALATYRTLHGETGAEVGQALANVGYMEIALGKRAEGIVKLSRALAIMEINLGPTHRDVLASRFVVGTKLYEAGDRAKGRAMAQAAYKALADAGDDNAKEARNWLDAHR